MTSAQANTKIERATEAIESLTIAVVAAQAGPAAKHAVHFNSVRDAREELREAFAEFLAPTLRVVSKNDAA